MGGQQQWLYVKRPVDVCVVQTGWMCTQSVCSWHEQCACDMGELQRQQDRVCEHVGMEMQKCDVCSMQEKECAGEMGCASLCMCEIGCDLGYSVQLRTGSVHRCGARNWCSARNYAMQGIGYVCFGVYKHLHMSGI